jgi:hypothetical protein
MFDCQHAWESCVIKKERNKERNIFILTSYNSHISTQSSNLKQRCVGFVFGKQTGQSLVRSNGQNRMRSWKCPQ